jgi:hypothetical protein
VSDKKPGGERSREDRLTDRIGLGVLTRLVHRDLVDEVLTDTGRTERRRRLLPAACAATTGTAGVVLGHQGTAAGFIPSGDHRQRGSGDQDHRQAGVPGA